MGNILEQHGTYLKIKEDNFFIVLVCEAWIHNSTYKIMTSEIALISQEQGVTVMIAISVKILTKYSVGLKKGNT